MHRSYPNYMVLTYSCALVRLLKGARNTQYDLIHGNLGWYSSFMYRDVICL